VIEDTKVSAPSSLTQAGLAGLKPGGAGGKGKGKKGKAGGYQDQLAQLREATLKCPKTREYGVTINTFQFLHGLQEAEVMDILSGLASKNLTLAQARPRAKLFKTQSMVKRRVVTITGKSNWEECQQEWPEMTSAWVMERAADFANISDTSKDFKDPEPFKRALKCVTTGQGPSPSQLGPTSCPHYEISDPSSEGRKATLLEADARGAWRLGSLLDDVKVTIVLIDPPFGFRVDSWDGDAWGVTDYEAALKVVGLMTSQTSAPVVMVHVPSSRIGQVCNLLESYHYNAAGYHWLNTRATDTGGPRFCSAVQHLVVATKGMAGDSCSRRHCRQGEQFSH